MILPLMDGASLALIGTGTDTVAIYDSGLAGRTFHNDTGFTYSLALPVDASGGFTSLDSIGADGQIGASRTGWLGCLTSQTTVMVY